MNLNKLNKLARLWFANYRMSRRNVPCYVVVLPDLAFINNIFALIYLMRRGIMQSVIVHCVTCV